MKAKKNYLLIFFTLLSGSIFGQNAEFRGQAISTNFSSIEIEVYQESAEKKIEDFYSYLNLLSEKTVSKKSKVEIKKNILFLFQNDQTGIVDFTSESTSQSALPYLLEEIEKKQIEFKLIKILSKEPMLYSDHWITEYTIEIIQKNKKSTANISQAIYFSPKNKKFGSNSKIVWEIKLGEIIQL